MSAPQIFVDFKEQLWSHPFWQLGRVVKTWRLRALGAYYTHQALANKFFEVFYGFLVFEGFYPLLPDVVLKFLFRGASVVSRPTTQTHLLQNVLRKLKEVVLSHLLAEFDTNVQLLLLGETLLGQNSLSPAFEWPVGGL